jgi:hypothetical protein
LPIDEAIERMRLGLAVLFGLSEAGDDSEEEETEYILRGKIDYESDFISQAEKLQGISEVTCGVIPSAHQQFAHITKAPTGMRRSDRYFGILMSLFEGQGLSLACEALEVKPTYSRSIYRALILFHRTAHYLPGKQ